MPYILEGIAGNQRQASRPRLLHRPDVAPVQDLSAADAVRYAHFVRALDDQGVAVDNTGVRVGIEDRDLA